MIYKNILLVLFCTFLFACQPMKKEKENSTSTEPVVKKDTSTQKNENLIWNDKTKSMYLKLCNDQADLNEGIDKNTFCQCILDALIAKNISPSETDKHLDSLKIVMQDCAKRSKK